MRQQILRFGPKQSLTGVLSGPEQGSVNELTVGYNLPVAVILNAGVVHRSGPFRLHVDLAQRLAQNGFSSLRLDLSGLGDSATRTDLNEGDDRAHLDVQDAFAALADSLDAKRFVLLGLCSGAYNAHNIALADSRVVGNVFLDGLVFSTAGHRRRVTVHRLTSPRFWRNATLRRLRASEIGTFDESAPSAAEFFELDKPAEVVASEITHMLGQGQQLLYLYTQGCEEFSSRHQFEEMFGIQPNEENLQVDYLPNFEHTFPLVYQRKFVVERITKWFERFGSKRDHATLLTENTAAQPTKLRSNGMF